MTITIATEHPASTPDNPFYQSYFAIKRGSMPGLLWAEMLDVLHDWSKFEQGKPDNRFEWARGKPKRGGFTKRTKKTIIGKAQFTKKVR